MKNKQENCNEVNTEAAAAADDELQTVTVHYHKKPDWGDEVQAFTENTDGSPSEVTCTIENDGLGWYTVKMEVPAGRFKGKQNKENKLKLVICGTEKPETAVDETTPSRAEEYRQLRLEREKLLEEKNQKRLEKDRLREEKMQKRPEDEEHRQLRLEKAEACRRKRLEKAEALRQKWLKKEELLEEKDKQRIEKEQLRLEKERLREEDRLNNEDEAQRQKRLEKQRLLEEKNQKRLENELKVTRIITSTTELWLTDNGKAKKNADAVNKYESNRVEWKKLNNWTKASFFVLGLSQIKHKRYFEGIAMMLIEIGFILFMGLAGVQSLINMVTLGTVAPGKDPVTGIVVDGDNSMLMLLYGVIGLVVIAIFVMFYVYCFKATVALDHAVRNNKKYSFLGFLKSFANDKLYILMLIIPLAGVLVFTIIPLIYMILIAFTNYDKEHMTNFFDWVGFQNFGYIFGQDARFTSTFWRLLGWTLIWAFFSTFTCFFGGMGLAMLIKNKKVKGKVIFRTIFVLTIAVPSFISLMSIGTMLDPDGVINQLLKKYGFIENSLPFLTDATWARVTVIVVNLWLGAPISMLITTGILLNIPSELFESARIDGASPWVIFKKIIMPYVMFVCTPYLINAFIANINNFNAIYFLTMNANIPNPGYANGALPTDLLVTWLYKLTVENYDYSYGSAIGIMVFIISAALSLILLRRSSSFKNEGSF